MGRKRKAFSNSWYRFRDLQVMSPPLYHRAKFAGSFQLKL